MYTIEKKRYDSFEELGKIVENKNLIFGDRSKINNRFEYVTNGEYNFGCGITYYFSGIDSEVIMENKNIFIGFDKQVLCINAKENEVILDKKCGSLFYEFIVIRSQSLIVSIFELDIIVSDLNGNFIWTMGFRDIIEEYKVKVEDTLLIYCSNGEEFEFRLRDGKYLV